MNQDSTARANTLLPYSREKGRAIEARNHAGARLSQRRRQRAQIIRTDCNIAVGQDNEGMASRPSDVDEIRDLAVRAMRGAVDDPLKIECGVSPRQRFDDRNRAVVRIPYAKHELYVPGEVLMEIGFDILR
jgi:hypothetical protein